jgi:hypothetical protein
LDYRHRPCTDRQPHWLAIIKSNSQQYFDGNVSYVASGVIGNSPRNCSEGLIEVTEDRPLSGSSARSLAEAIRDRLLGAQAIEQSEKRPFAALVREAKAVARIAVIFR